MNLIKFYQTSLSSSNYGVHACRFVPSCSQYTYEAVEKYGVVKGLGKGFWRVLRCNPLNKGGADPLI